MASPPIYNKDDFCGETITKDPSISQTLCSALPNSPFDGQIFVDANGIQWSWSDSKDAWTKIGVPSTVPLASSTTTGLLSRKNKIILDSVPPVGGSFGLITQPFILANPDNPDGVTHGNIELCSESLDIKCVDAQNIEYTEECVFIVACDIQDQMPGLQFKLSDVFLKTLCFEAFGPAGPIGRKGDTGDAGKDGFKNSPKGETGDPGSDATAPASLLGIKIEDIEEIRDTVAVDVTLDPATGKLSYALAKMNVPENDEPADQVLATPTQRTLFYPLLADDPVEYTTLDDWRVSVSPGDPIQEPDLILFQVPSSTAIGDEIQLQPIRLSQFIEPIVEHYKNCLKQYDDAWLREICEFISAKDAAAREIIARMAQRVAECEFKRPIQFCLGIEPGDCPEGARTFINTRQFNDIIDINIVPSQPPPSPEP